MLFPGLLKSTVSVDKREQGSHGCQVRDHTATALCLCYSERLKETEMYTGPSTEMETAADLVRETLFLSLSLSKDWCLKDWLERYSLHVQPIHVQGSRSSLRLNVNYF